MERILRVLGLSVLVLGVSGCDDLPLGVYSLSSDPLPENAQAVSPAQFDQLSFSSSFHSVTDKSVGEQEAAALKAERENDKVIGAYLKAHPQLDRLIPDEPNENHIVRNHDGSYSHSLHYNHGAQGSVITLGARWAKASVAGGIRTFSTRQNQLALYRQLYVGLTDELRGELQLPNPDEPGPQANAFTKETLFALNRKITANREKIRLAMLAAETSASVAAPARCSDEEGAGTGTDRTGNRENDPACQPRANGIFANYSWPAKSQLTCVKDQGGRGSCVAFSTVSAVENLVLKSTSHWVNLSEQQLYEHAKLVWTRDDFTDGINALGMLILMSTQDWHLPLETTWQYNPSYSRQENSTTKLYSHSCTSYTGTCSNSSHQARMICTDKDKYRYCGFLAQESASTGYRVSDYSEIWNFIDHNSALDTMLSVLQLGQPVVWSFSVTPSWDAANGDGFVHFNGTGEKNRGGHAVHVTGYIDNATLLKVAPNAPPGSGGGYLIVKNSWTNCWGDAGYVYVPYDFVRAYTLDAEALRGVATAQQ